MKNLVIVELPCCHALNVWPPIDQSNFTMLNLVRKYKKEIV